MYAVIGIWKANNVKILINKTDIHDDKWIFLRELPWWLHNILFYFIWL